MLSLKAIYDGKQLKFVNPVKVNSPQEVIVTFLEEIGEDISSDEMHAIAEKGGGLDFLFNEGEDVYTEKDLKVKYKK